MTKKLPPNSTDFAADVYSGLTSSIKHLSSKYFYDKEGDLLFQKIMDLPEYYLTRLEYQILENRKKEIVELFSKGEKRFHLIDLGAGDAKKTKILLRQLVREEIPCTYVPVDISKNSVDGLLRNLSEEFPHLEVLPEVGSYHQVLERLAASGFHKKVFLLLGSNIGNSPIEQSAGLLESIQKTMKEDDLLFVGVDQKKHPKQILEAYNDASGVTEAFNKNLLLRINRELEADFDPDSFLHWPIYDPEKSRMMSFLVSKKAQKVHIKSLNLEVPFKAWESIRTEVSQKFDEDLIADMASQAGLRIFDSIGDTEGFFRNYIFKKHKL